MDILAKLLGIDEGDADQVRKVVKSLADDLPSLATRVEETEILVKAIANYMRERDERETGGVLWRAALDKAKDQVAKQNARIRTKIPGK